MGKCSIHRGQCDWSKVSKGTIGIKVIEGRTGAEGTGPCRLVRILAFTLSETESNDLT